tara:strand:- start:762 stop:1295 length:534 start_codon:yes stop_codon:yes gene_type:complete
VFAEDISDFQIEGMSIGDNLLNFFSINEIENATDTHYYKNKKYVFYLLTNISNYKTYQDIQVTVINKPKTFIIHEISGIISYRYNIQDCYEKQNQIKNELEIAFNKAPYKDTGSHPGDKTGKSKYVRFSYDFQNDSYAQIVCFDMSKKLENNGQWDALYITLTSDAFANFMTYENYE